jgi:hypothetical protein
MAGWIAGHTQEMVPAQDQRPGSGERWGPITFYAHVRPREQPSSTRQRRLGRPEDPAGCTPYRRGPRRY